MNNTTEPFTNEKVRQAIAMGIDKQRIVDSFYPAGSTVADCFTPCSIPFACGGEPFSAFDPEAAKALLAEGLAELGLEAFPEVPISLRVVDRAYLPFPGRWPWTSRTSSGQPRHHAPSTSRSRAPSSTTPMPAS